MTAAQPDSVLRHRPFVLFWCARLSVTMGYQMLVVAVAWQLYALNTFAIKRTEIIRFGSAG